MRALASLGLLLSSALVACATDPNETSASDELAATGVWHELGTVTPYQQSFDLLGSAPGSIYVGQYVRINIPQSCGPTAIEDVELFEGRAIRALTGRFTTPTRLDVPLPPGGFHVDIRLEKPAKVTSFRLKGRIGYVGTCSISVALNDTSPIAPPPLPVSPIAPAESNEPTLGECEAVKNEIGVLYPDHIEKIEVRPAKDGPSCSVYVQFKRWQVYREFKLAYGLRPTLFPYTRPAGDIDVNVIATFVRF